MGWLDGGVGVLPVVVGVLVVDGLVVNSGKGVKGSKGNFEKSRLVKADPGIFFGCILSTTTLGSLQTMTMTMTNRKPDESSVISFQWEV